MFSMTAIVGMPTWFGLGLGSGPGSGPGYAHLVEHLDAITRSISTP